MPLYIRTKTVSLKLIVDQFHYKLFVAKSWKKIVRDQVYGFINVNNLLSRKQFGFRPGDSTTYQLLCITSTIYDSFEKYDETRWIVFKLKCNGIYLGFF